MTFGGGEGEVGGEVLLTLTLELWQNDTFLMLMWNYFIICRIVQLILEIVYIKMSIMMLDYVK